MKSGNLQEEFAGVVARVESLRGRMGCLRVCWRRILVKRRRGGALLRPYKTIGDNHAKEI